jgi:hypothetical protein
VIYTLVYVLNVADLVLTHYAVNVAQIAEEANPLMAPIVSSWVMVPIKLIIPLAVLIGFYCVRSLKLARVATWILLVFYIFVVFNNSLVILAGLDLKDYVFGWQ